jgi:hypothetical protein
MWQREGRGREETEGSSDHVQDCPTAPRMTASAANGRLESQKTLAKPPNLTMRHLALVEPTRTNVKVNESARNQEQGSNDCGLFVAM